MDRVTPGEGNDVGRNDVGRNDVGRSRAGNAMARTRAAVLAGARRCVLTAGTRRTTMVDIAATSGVAKATLYNHFRTKGEVLAALADSEVATALADTGELVAGADLETALVRLLERAGEHPVVRRLAETEPAVLAAIVVPGPVAAPTWARARLGLGELLGDHPAAVEPLLRLLVSQLLWPSPRDEASSVVGLLLRGTQPAAPAAVAALAEPGAETVATAPVSAPGGLAGGERSTVPGLGYPADGERVGELVTVAVPPSRAAGPFPPVGAV